MGMICPQCCAAVRNADCVSCSYYVAAENYQIEKLKKSGGRSFTSGLDETTEQQVDNALADIENRQIAKAEKSLTELFQSHPDNHYIRFGMGTLHALKNENQKAIEHFQKAIDIFPYFLHAHYNLGIAFKKEVDIARMIRAFQNVIRIGTPDELCYRETERMLADIQKMLLKDKVKDLDTFLRAQDLFEKGLQQMLQGDWSLAIETFMESSRLNPGPPQPFGNIGICHAKMGEKEAAIESFDRALAIDPGYELAIVNKALTLMLAPGEVLGGPVKTVEYYKEYGKNRSYIREITEPVAERPELPPASDHEAPLACAERGETSPVGFGGSTVPNIE